MKRFVVLPPSSRGHQHTPVQSISSEVRMPRLSTVTLLLFTFISVENRIYLDNTNDGLDIESYDCFLLESLLYCRRPTESIHLTRDKDIQSCGENGGQLHRFSQLGALFCINGDQVSNESKNIHSFSEMLVSQTDLSVNVWSKDHLERTVSINYPKVKHSKRHSNGN